MSIVLLIVVYESFKDYVAVEVLDGENKYDAGSHGLQVSLVTEPASCRTQLSFFFFVSPLCTASQEGCHLPHLSSRAAPSVDEIPVRSGH